MKLNWGTSIVIAFALFMSFIMYFVIKVQSDSKYDNELVVEEYYKHDSHFGEEMVKIQNAEDLVNKPDFLIDTAGISIVFPKEFLSDNVKGKALLYRASNKKFDFEVPIMLEKSMLFIPKTKLIRGQWYVILEWQYNGKQYISKKAIYF